MKFKKELDEELDSLNLTESAKDKAELEIQQMVEETGGDYNLCLSIWEANNGFTKPFSIDEAKNILLGD